MTAASDRTSTMPARTVAALRLLASRWLRSCWITRWECCGWGEEDVLVPKHQPPHGPDWDPAVAVAGMDRSEIPRPAGTGGGATPQFLS